MIQIKACVLEKAASTVSIYSLLDITGELVIPNPAVRRLQELKKILCLHLNESLLTTIQKEETGTREDRGGQSHNRQTR